MRDLLNQLIAQQDKTSVPSKVKPGNSNSLRRAIHELAAAENAKVLPERRVTIKDVETVASRALTATAGLEKRSRFFAAYREVSSFIALAVYGQIPLNIAKNRDLLPIGHPLSTRKHAMTASAYSESIGRWIAADPRIDDSAREIVAAAYSYPADSIEAIHANTRLRSLTAGLVPREYIIDSQPFALVASFKGWLSRIFGGGNSSAARSLRAKAQLRDREGKFAEQGGGLQFYVRMPDGSYKSKVGSHAGNAANGKDFLVEVSNDPDVPDGIISVPANITKAVKAIIPGDDAGPVGLPDGVDAINLSSIERKDVPDGWKLVKEKGEGEAGPDKVYASDDGYEVEVYDAGNFDKPELTKAFRFNAGLMNEVPGQPVGNFTKRLDFDGRANATSKFDPNKPLYNLYRVETPETKRQAVLMAQKWSDIQQDAENDQDNFEKYYEAAEKANAEKAQKQAKAAEESKASQEAMNKQAEEVMKANEKLRAEIDSNLAKGLDPYGNTIPNGWVATKNDDALNPPVSWKTGDKEYVTKPIKKEDAVFYNREEQGFSAQLSHTEDGGLKGIYQDQEFKDWNEAEDGFAEAVEADVNARREAALDVADKYDESGDVRQMIENGASPEEILQRLDEIEQWKSNKSDYDTRWAVDLPQKPQRDKWKAFESELKAIQDMPSEFKEIEKQEVQARLPEEAAPETKPASQLKPGDKIVDPKGNVRTVKKNSSVDSGTMITFDDKKYRIYDDQDEVQLAPGDTDEPPASAPEPEPTPEPTPEPEAKPVAETKPESTDIDWVLQDGAFKLWKPEDYEPEGRIDEDSPDFTDDPKVLANKFSTEELTSAFAQAVIGVKDFATEFLEDLDDIDGEDSKPGPKKKKAKSKEASGFGRLDFEYGEELVPAEAIYNALNEKGEDAQMLLAQLYDLGSGESKNVDLVNKNRSGESVEAQGPSILDDFDEEVVDLIDLNKQLASPEGAAYAVSQLNEAVSNGEPNPRLKEIADDLNSLEEVTDVSQLLAKYIEWGVAGDDDQKQAFSGLFAMMLSADGGYTSKSTDSMFKTSVGNALQSYNGSQPTQAEIDAVFDEYGYYPDLMAGKKRIADGDDDIFNSNTTATAFYRLIAAMTKPNESPMYRGIQVGLDSEELQNYINQGDVIALDPRSFSKDKAIAGNFAGAFGQNPENAAVIFTVPAGGGNFANIDNFDLFSEEQEQLGWGNYKIAEVAQKVNPAGKTLYNVRLEALSKREAVLDGFDAEYEELLIENQDIDLPEGYYSQNPNPYLPLVQQGLPNGAGIPDEFDDSPLYIARSWETTDLIDAYREAIQDGSGVVLLEYPIGDGYEANVDVEAVRDALQIQGLDTNKILEDVASSPVETDGEEADEAVPSSLDDPVAEIVSDVSKVYDLEGWKKVGPQLGSNEGGFYEDADGNRYYVKTPKSDLHAENEALASALYRAVGIDAAEVYIGSADDNVTKTYTPDIVGSKDDLQERINEPEYAKKVQEGFAIDAWLANWDVAGLTFDNIMSDGDGNPVRVDPGGALLFRAQGAPKGDLFGNEVNELDSLKNFNMNQTGAAIYDGMTEEDEKASAEKLLGISNEQIDVLVDNIISDAEAAEKLKATLKARREYILDRYDLLDEDTSALAENVEIEEPSAEVEELEEPTPPAPETPSETPANQYVTSDGVPIDIGMQVRHKKTGEVGTVIKYDKGNTNYVFVQGEDGSIKNKSTKQLESLNGGGGPGGEEPTPEPEPTPAPEATPEPELPEAQEASTAVDYKKVDKKADFLLPGDLLPKYFPIKGAEQNLLNKRADDPDFELPATDEVIGRYKATFPNKIGLKVRDLKTGKERYFEVNKTAKMYDVRVPIAPATPDPTPEEPEVPAPEPEAELPETQIPATLELQTAATPEPKTIDTTGTVENAVKDIQAAIDNDQLITFYYNGKVRIVKPESAWENPKNGKINLYGADLGDEGKKKNFTVQQMQQIPESEEASKPEGANVEEPAQEPAKLQLHAQWIKNIMAFKGVSISDEKAIELRDLIDSSGALAKWSSAEDSDIIEALNEVIGPFWEEAAEFDTPNLSKVEPETTEDQQDYDIPISDEQRQIIVNMITKLAGIEGFEVEKYVNAVGNPSLTSADGSALLQELEDIDDQIGNEPKVQPPVSDENFEGPEFDEEGDDEEEETASPEAPTLEPGAEVTDKKGNKGTVLKGPNKDNYVFVQFEDGKTGWRSANSVSTTGEFNNNIKNATPKPAAGKITPAGTTAVFVENPAGWDTSEFENVPSLSDAIAIVQNPDDKAAAMRGASAAVDADNIEDLDVRIMRVRDAEGNDGVRLKFKLTSWAGNARVKQLLAMTPEELSAQGIVKGPMVVDRIDVGPDGVGQISKEKHAYAANNGNTWTITTSDGIIVKLYRGNVDATSKLKMDKYNTPRSFHNLVQIQAPADATNEQIADAMRLAGVADVRPSTPADARILVENRLMSVFDGKIDATKNLKSKEREESLQRIKDKYGITPDDVIITTGVSGRIETRLSAEAAQKIVAATGNPTAIQHNIKLPGLYGASDPLDKISTWIAGLLSTPQGGLLSTTTRWTEGIGGTGMSSEADVGTGGADYVFTKPVKVAEAKEYGTSGVVMYFDPNKVYQRLDFYANGNDNYGKRIPNQDVINAAQVGAYELMFKHRLSYDDLDSVVISTQAMRTAVIQKLRQMGIDQIGGRPLEAVIIIGSKVQV